jgi:hypothetical protein
VHERGEVSWPTRTLQSTVFNADGPRPVAFAKVTDLIATLSWLFPDAMVKRLDAMLAEEADDASALSIPDRRGQALQIQSDLLAAERDLAWVVWRGLDEGLTVWFPQGLSAVAILGAELMTLPAGNRPGSSPEHASYSLIGGRR